MSSRCVWGAFGIALFIAGCADAEGIAPPSSGAVAPVEHTVSFAGYLYDGATGARIESYGIDIQVADTVQNGTVDAGRYLVPPISAWDDFTVLIDASGYRPFRSHNSNIGLPFELAQSDDISEIGTHQTLHFDAYLFPEGLQAPAVTFTITTDTGASPGGTIRLRPQGKSLLEDTTTETPSGVPGQLWSNDEDLQAQIISRTFSDGTFAISAGELVYGVTYQVSIYDAAGFQPLQTTFTAGVESDKTFTLLEEVTEPLAVVSSTANSCTPPSLPSSMSGAIVTVQFNQDVEEADSGYPGGAAEALDDGLSMVSPDADIDMIDNTLQNDVSNATQELGVTVTFVGNTMTISWNPSVGLSVIDDDDPILSVTYSGLGNVQVQRLGSPSSATSLAALVASSITCTP